VTARGGRRNGTYAWVPLWLANDCPKCQATRGRKCGRWVAEQWKTNETTHVERRRKRGGTT
jgi:hypothetical protein